ncbi:MAG: hypothetical protein F4155_07885 [Acidimicrobiales bacterium]|nr:hypothetical protein [Acidimicrobiales bacterium]MYH74705.1 hypothetical protein [Acidimicrobiales bacterium]MYK72834.1 hypothetical protein [Acidimicrobiales bacterium]
MKYNKSQATSRAESGSVARHSRALLLATVAVVLATAMSCSVSYTDVEVGVEEIVEEYIESRNTYTRYRTFDEAKKARDIEYEWFQNEASEQERERYVFEQLIRGRMIGARDALPEELKPGGALELAYNDSLDECVSSAGYQGLRLHDNSLEYFNAALVDYQLTEDEYFDLNHECAKYAAEYPTLSESERGRLLDMQRDFYRNIVRDFLEDNPEAVVPLQ